jgi:hypothetical protein
MEKQPVSAVFTIDALTPCPFPKGRAENFRTRSEERPDSLVPRPSHIVPSPAVKNHARGKPIQDKAVGSRLICNSQFAIRNSQSTKKKAFSILEVILALAILTGAIAVLGEIGHFGFRNAKASQDLTRAQLLCESKMAEFTSGVSIPQAVQGVAFDTIDQDSNMPWVYSVDMDQVANQEGLIALRVTVTQNLPGAQRPLSFSLTRWIIDPTITSAASTDSTQESTTSASGTGTSSTSGSGTSSAK